MSYLFLMFIRAWTNAKHYYITYRKLPVFEVGSWFTEHKNYVP